VVPAACSSTGTTRMKVSSTASRPRTAAQLCSGHGGVYHAGGDYCEVDNGMFWK
jgi:hypothetical protein